MAILEKASRDKKQYRQLPKSIGLESKQFEDLANPSPVDSRILRGM
jgi:hypothetical protein